MGNLRCGGKKSFSARTEVFISFLYTKEMKKSHYLSISQPPSNTGFFQVLFQFFPVANLIGNFKPDLCWCLSQHKTTLLRYYKSTVFLHKLVIGSHREDRICSCSYIQLTASDWKNPDSLCSTSSHSEMCTASSPPSIQQRHLFHRY